MKKIQTANDLRCFWFAEWKEYQESFKCIHISLDDSLDDMVERCLMNIRSYFQTKADFQKIETAVHPRWDSDKPYRKYVYVLSVKKV